MTDRWATFDCYGTLVDWLGGMRGTFARLWPDADPDALLGLYRQLEPAVQAGRGLAYREVMAETLATTAGMARLDVPPGEEDALGASLPAWPVFAEVPSALAELRTRGWKVAILSNTDADFLDVSLRAIGVPVDLRIVASEIDRIATFQPRVRSSASAEGTSAKTGHAGSEAPSASSSPGGTSRRAMAAVVASVSAITSR